MVRIFKLTVEYTVAIPFATAIFKMGNAIRQGVPVAIVGEPNSGKSTLLNALLGEQRAIVSDIPGTTRDTVEETLNIGGVKFRFIDTAGLRESDETIEKIGIERSYAAISKAKVILLVIDAVNINVIDCDILKDGVFLEKYKYVNSLVTIQDKKIKDFKLARDNYKNAFLESEKLFQMYVKDKNLRNLINFNNNFIDPV